MHKNACTPHMPAGTACRAAAAAAAARHPVQQEPAAPRMPPTTMAGAPVPPRHAAASGQGITCLAGGTMVVTTRGEAPVEALRAGDMMLTMHGAPARQPLLRVSRSHVDLARHADPARLFPILIKAGALMRGAPIRDLRVSPGQGLFLDGQLVPARLLVNGTSILQDSRSGAVTYHYLWLDGHDLLIADGALTESSFEDDWQPDFGGAANVAAITPDVTGRIHGATPKARCARLLLDGPDLAAIQQRLALRATPGTAS